MNNLVGTELPFEATPAAISEWIDALPVLNTVQTAEKIYRALQALNTLEIKPALHFELLEQLKETVYLLSPALEKYFLDTSFPLQKKELKLAKLSTHLHRELSSNYSLICKSEAFLDPEKFSPGQQASTIKCALHSLSLEQLLVAQRYEACSTRFWTQFYELLALTEQLNFQSTDDTLVVQESNALELIAKRLLLFSLCNPNRFSQREIKGLYNLLGEHTELAKLDDQPTDCQSKKAGFFMMLDSSQSPQHISRLNLDSSSASVRYIHTNNLVIHLIDQFKTLLSSEQESCLISNRRMLGKIVRSLGAPERRRRQRHKSESPECTIIPGLENIITFLSEHEKPKTNKKLINPVRTASELWNDIPDFGIIPLDENNLQIDHLRNNQRDENVANTTLINSKYQVTSSEIWGQGSLPTPKTGIKPLDCKVLDVSTKGFHLLWVKEANAKIKVSEIISISQPGQPMKTGVVRWIEQDRESGLSFGIELLSPITQLVTASSPKQPDSEIKGILIHELPEVGIQQSLLISPSKYRTGSWVNVKNETVTRRYRLQKLLETSPSFVQFTLFKLDKTE